MKPRIPQYIIDLVRAMDNNPESPDGLRAFHRKQLVDLEARAKPVPESKASPFSRFADKLTEQN